MSKNVTMRDIAEKLGISVVAVSKGLSGKSGVSAELRSRIKRTADEMGYIISSDAKKRTPTAKISAYSLRKDTFPTIPFTINSFTASPRRCSSTINTPLFIL